MLLLQVMFACVGFIKFIVAYQSVLLVGTSMFLQAVGFYVGLSIGQLNGCMESLLLRACPCALSHMLCLGDTLALH